MKHLELHIIQSVPVSCLNRDDLNSPKTATFGGVQRARVSSQSWKRAIREMATNELDPSGHFRGERSRLFIAKISNALANLGESQKTANTLSLCAGHYLAKLDPREEGKVKTLMFLSPLEYEIFASVLHSLEKTDKQKLLEAVDMVDLEKLSEDESEDTNVNEQEPEKKNTDKKKLTAKQFTKLVDKVLKSPLQRAFKDKNQQSKGLPKDAADIALFGRMVANDATLKIEAAAMFSHALSTHKVDNEIDFFAAVDEIQREERKEESGAGMTSTLEFNSATYYRFAALNIDMLADNDHLGSMNREERQTVVRTFLEATIGAIPGARKNTMNGNTIPSYVLGVVREKGHPIQLINAFENPVRANNGYASQSIEQLKLEYAKLSTKWGIAAVFEKAVPEVSLNELLDGMVAHVN